MHLSPHICSHQQIFHFILCTTGKEIVEKNRRFFTSIVKCLEFYGRQGLAPRGHRDDSAAPDKRQKGSFKGHLDFHVDAGDQVLQEHLEICSKIASYISKTTQNELLECIIQYVQGKSISPKFSVHADELLI